MTVSNLIFDPKRIRRNRQRAKPCFAKHDFLHQRIWQDIQERRDSICRELPNGAIHSDLLPEPTAATMTDLQRNAAGTPYGSDLDILISFLELHLIDALPQHLIAARKSLKPDGVFLAALFGGNTLTELRQSLLAAESEITGGAAARIIPFVETRTLGGLVQAAGFALPVIDVDTITVRYSSLQKLLRDIKNMGEGNPFAAPTRPLTRAIMLRTEEIYQQKFGDKDGAISARFDVLHICGWSPHPDQPKAKPRGSGQVFLGDALKNPKP